SLGPRAGTGGRRDPRPWQAHGEHRLAGDGAWVRSWLRALPPCAEPSTLVEPRRSAETAGDDPCGVLAQRARGDWHGWNDRAPVGAKDRGARDLPRPGALDAWTFRQGQWPALAFPDGHGANPLYHAALGPALSDDLGALATLERGARSTPQEAD